MTKKKITPVLLTANKVYINAITHAEGSCLTIKIATEDGSPLYPQAILDAVSDYLIIDPKGLFKDIREGLT